MRVYRYQLTLRPFSFCTVPAGYVTSTGRELKQHRPGNYGSICWAQKLTAEQVERYDLQYLGEENICERCGSEKLEGQSCSCFDNNCQ